MSRKKREWYPGAMYHVMSRGNRRTVLFKDKADYLRFLECVERAGSAIRRCIRRKKATSGITVSELKEL